MNIATVNTDTGEVINESVIKDNELEEYRREKQSPYEDFAQFNLAHSEDWIKLNKKSHIATEILMFLMKHADRYNALVCSVNLLAEALGYGRTSITLAIKILKETGFIDIKKSGNTNVFLLNKDLVWKSWGRNYKYAEFGAKIIISESEQEKLENTKTKHINVVELKAGESRGGATPSGI